MTAKGIGAVGLTMDYPDDLPCMIEWYLPALEGRVTVLTSLPRSPVRSVSSSGTTDAATVRPNIPYGARGWRLPGEKEWRPLATLPESWLPFLNRGRRGAAKQSPARKPERALPSVRPVAPVRKVEQVEGVDPWSVEEAKSNA